MSQNIATAEKTSNIGKAARVLMRVIQFAISVSMGVFAIFYVAQEMKSADASVTHGQQFVGTVIFSAAYLGIAVLAARDVRASSIVAVIVALLSTPLYAFLWLMSQWTPQSAHRAIPLLWAITGNVVLFVLSNVAFVISIRDQNWVGASRAQ